MTPGKFLRLIWPDTGYYCIAHPFTPKGSAITVYAHKVFSTISEAVTHVHRTQNSADTYFAILTLENERFWDPEKKDFKTGQPGAWAVRKQENMLASKCSFFDLDVGDDPAKYPTQRDALLALIDFCKVTKLPRPTLVSSGGGIHVYWHYDTSVPVADWRPIALHMRQLAEHHGLKVDPTRTTDVTSVLRVPDTFNWKDRSNPRAVKVMQEGVVTPVEEFKRIVSDAMISAGVVPDVAPATRAAPIPGAEILGSNIEFNDFGPKPEMADVAAACGQVQEILRSHGDPTHPFYGALDNTAWYRGMLATFKHIEKGEEWAHKLTNLFPRTNAEIDAKLQQLEQFGPARCETLQQYMPWKAKPCEGCRFLNDAKTPNPIVAARRTATAEPPKIELKAAVTPGAPGAAVQQAIIPNPPPPFSRLKTGGIAVTSKNSDGDETTTLIYPHDLYPLRRLTNTEEDVEQQVWHVKLPRIGLKEFVIDAAVLYDSRKFATTLANHGIYPTKANLPLMQDYMVAYISRLQKELDADAQSSHLGWTSEYSRFVLPDKVLVADGSVEHASLTKAAERAAQFVTKRGELAEQIKLMQFYNNPAYIPNQAVILGSLASIIFYATGHHGIVVNCSGEAGASKSTTLYTAASMWGDPKLWPINGTNRGATANARSQRMVTNANLPTCVDEITHLPPRDAIDMVMSITQPGHRLRLQTDGAERRSSDNYKSAVMIATANSSLHSLLSTDNAAGTAGSVRVFEMRFDAQRVHTKAEADEYLRNLNLHYGHLGEIFAHFVAKNRIAVENRVQQLVREVDQAADIQSSERFWSAYIAAVLCAAEVSKALGILPFEMEPIRQWAITRQIPYMRGVLGEEYRDPLAILTDYIAEAHGGIVVVDKATSIGGNTSGKAVASESAFNLNTPHGALLGHFDMKAGVLILLKQGFKDYCTRIGASSSRLLEDLHTPRGDPPMKVVVNKNARRTLGAGTPLAKGQNWCFLVDMNHPALASTTQLTTVTSDPVKLAPIAQAGNDQ